MNTTGKQRGTARREHYTRDTADPSAVELELTRGQWVLIDRADIERVTTGPVWYANPLLDADDNITGWRACRCVPGPKGSRTRQLTRWLMNPERSQLVMARNGDMLDCRRANLRIVSHSEYRGIAAARSRRLVGAFPEGSRWRARIQRGGSHISLGSYDTAEEAHEAYMAAASKWENDTACTI